MNKEIEKLIIKFLTKEANLDELKQLEIWINNPKNEALFFECIKTNAFINMTMSNYDKNSAKENIVLRIKQERSIFYKKSKTNSIIKYAAAVIVIGLLTSTYVFRNNLFNSPDYITPVIVNTTLESGSDKAILTLEDGSEVALGKGTSFKSKNIQSNGEEIIYDTTTKNGKPKTAFNYLTIPRGGEFFIKLSDGTQVWLNSESQLKYPISFEEGATRQVELVYGEAFLVVSPSTNHKGSKFKVLNKSQEIEVLGTEFNIKAYKDEKNVYTTLIEGKVEIKTSKAKQVLAPNQQSKVDIENNNISVAVVDVKEVTSWVHGNFVFQSKSMKEITKVLSRWYDVEIEIRNKSLEDVKFNGELSKHQNLEDLLILIKNTNFINKYEINDKKVILN